MKISIFTDASVSHEYNVGGYAFYIGCVEGKIQKAGIFRGKISADTNVAELKCIANALHTLLHAKFSPATSVFIFTDSLSSIHHINNKARFKTIPERDLVDEIKLLMMEYCQKHLIPIRNYRKLFNFQHIKAHTKKKDKPSLINHWCDKQANAYNCKAVAKAKKELKTILK